jgi:ketosteroid isomerase-like protein
MSAENVAVVCNMVEAWARGDRDQARAAYDPHVVLIFRALDAPVSYGIAAMEHALESWRRTFDDWRLEIEEAIDGGEHVIVVHRQWGTGKESGVPVEVSNAVVYSLRGSKIIRVETFESRAEALEAAGLSE